MKYDGFQPGFVRARRILRDGGNIRVISHDSLPDDAIVCRIFLIESLTITRPVYFMQIFRGHFMG
jgi:hypothetical protein